MEIKYIMTMLEEIKKELAIIRNRQENQSEKITEILEILSD